MKMKNKKMLKILMQSLVGNQAGKTHFKIGRNYMVRTVTMIVTGKLMSVNAQELLLDDPAWVADAGRWHEALENIDNLKEVERYPRDSKMIVGRGALVDAVEIAILPTTTK